MEFIKRYILFIIVFLGLSSGIKSASLYVDNFNNGEQINLLNGTYRYDYWKGGYAVMTWESNMPFGNSGSSLKFTYTLNASTNCAQILMHIYPDHTINLADYSYLSFWIKGQYGTETCKVMLEDSAHVFPAVPVKNYLPGGKITTDYQKVVIPLTAFRYNDFNSSRVSNIYFFIGNGLDQGTKTIYIDELIFSKGTTPVWIDNMESVEPVDLDGLGFEINNEGDGLTVRKMTNDKAGGDKACYLRQITDVPAGTTWAQTVWMFKYPVTPYVDASGCDHLELYAKKGSNRLSEKLRYLALGYNGGNAMLDFTNYHLTTSWKKFTIDLNDFSSADLTQLQDFKFVSANNGGITTNITFLDEIRLIDTSVPDIPTDIRVNNILLTNHFLIFQGDLKITSYLADAESADSSLESVLMEYRKNNEPWQIISFDYKTEKHGFTNFWSAGTVAGTNNIDIRVSAMDASGNISSVIFNDGTIRAPVNNFSVSFSNVEDPDTVYFGPVKNGDSPFVARNNASRFSFADINYTMEIVTSWTLVIYTDNTNVSAVPRFHGILNSDSLKYGNVNDGTGLVGTGQGAYSNQSIPVKVWCDTKYSDGNYYAAPCEKWTGSKTELQGIPLPLYQGKETNLYWKNQDLNNNGQNDNVIITNTHWLESSKNYDANGDGDCNDSSTGTSGDRLGKVFEYSAWKSLTASYRTVKGAQTVILASDRINNNMPGNVRVYFAVTDDRAGLYKTDQLIFELIIH